MAGRGWSAEIFVAEYRDLQATAMGVDRTGQYAILAGRKQLAIVDLDDPIEKVRRIARHSKYEVGVVQWNPHESHRDLFVVASNQSAEISCWLADKVESKGMLKGHTRVISDLDWSYFDADWVATCSVDTYIYLWDIRDTRKPAVSLSAVAGASQVKWNKKSCNLIATAHESDVRIWDQRKGTTPVQYIAAHLSKVHGLDWSPTQEWSLATSSQDCHVKLWDVCNPRKPESTISSGAPVWRARYTPFGEGLVTVVVPQLRRGDNSLLLWNINDVSVPVHTFVGHQDVILEFQWRKLGDDSKDFHLVTWSKDQSLRIWNIDSHLQKTCRHDLLNDSGNEADVDSAVEAMSNTSRDAPREQPPPVATATRAAAAVATVTSPGQTLQQEFSLVNMQIDNISIDSH
ncbi:PREDICTED: WD repeat-containing protein 59-like [Priapulus caudatus]|uniref:WD repeat-containing protein 59-like n=1 Tax=Priapulus caudatus TaxID=37621 RepID=A0ABM1EQC9_PRICU|nr:PREDICTED: WD repeat-containing protein 59-like [Priapulus caudatus]